MSTPIEPVEASPPRRKSTLGRILRIVLVLGVIALLVVFARTVNWHEAWTMIRNADRRWIAAAAVVNLLSIAVKGVRWWIFLRRVGVKGLWLALRATMAGAGLNNVLVANGGEAARVVFVSRACGVPAGTIFATLALERMFDIIGYVVLLAIATLTLPLPGSLSRWRWPAAVAVVVILGLLWWLVIRGRARRGDAMARAATPVATVTIAGGWWTRLVARLRGAGSQFLDAVAMVAGVRRFSAAFLLSMLAWGLQLATFSWTARAAGVHLPLAGDVATLLAVNLGFLLRATPGNVGFFQLAYALAAVPFGAERDAAIAASLLLQTLQIIPVTLLGVAMAPEFLVKRKTAVPPSR